jgi:predicted ArsR family transcriptional regulator
VSLIKVERGQSTEIIDAVIVEGPAERILEALGKAGDQGLKTGELADKLGVSRMTILRHLTVLTETDQIAAIGNSRSRRYIRK